MPRFVPHSLTFAASLVHEEEEKASVHLRTEEGEETSLHVQDQVGNLAKFAFFFFSGHDKKTRASAFLTEEEAAEGSSRSRG